MTKSQVCLGLTCLSFGIFACESEPEQLEISSAEAALTASDNTERALQGMIDAAEFLASSTSIAQSLSVFGRSETCESSGFYCAGVDCPPPETVCTTDEVSEADLEQARQDVRESAHALVQRLREEILIEANIESETSTSATYRLGPDVLCAEDTPSDAGAVAAEPTLDPDCAERVEQLEPRLVLTSPRAGDIDVQLLLGAERHAPLSLQLYQRRLGVRVDLGEGLAVARELGEDLGSIHELSGAFELRLLQNAELDYSLELNVLEAIQVEAESDDGDPVSVSLGASAPAWNVRVNGNEDTLSAGVDLGAFRLTGPLRAYAGLFGAADGESREQTGILELFLAGLSGNVSYTANSDVLSFTNIGYGDQTSTLKHDGNTLLALDLNATQGRRVNLTVTPSEDGARIEIEPSFELRVALAFQHVADQFEGLAEHLLDDTLRIWFEGDHPSVETGADQLRVTSGTLHVESSAEPSVNVSVAAGMCLAGLEDEDDTSDAEATDPVGVEGSEPEPHPLLGLEVTTCE